MGLFGRRRRATDDDRPTAFPISYEGPAPYMKSLGDGCGVVFEDDGESGYFYATDAEHATVHDALHLFDAGDRAAPAPGDQLFVVWHPSLRRAGLFYGGRFHAVFDFAAHRGVCRDGQPAASAAGNWSPQGHAWDEDLVAGLEP